MATSSLNLVVQGWNIAPCSAYFQPSKDLRRVVLSQFVVRFRFQFEVLKPDKFPPPRADKRRRFGAWSGVAPCSSWHHSFPSFDCIS